MLLLTISRSRWHTRLPLEIACVDGWPLHSRAGVWWGRSDQLRVRQMKVGTAIGSILERCLSNAWTSRTHEGWFESFKSR